MFIDEAWGVSRVVVSVMWTILEVGWGKGGLRTRETYQKTYLMCFLKNLARNSLASLSEFEIRSLEFYGLYGPVDNGLRGITCDF